MSASTPSSSLAARLARWADRIGAALFAAMFLALVFQVVFRFVFDKPAAWTEELATIAYVWVIFWGCAFSVPLAAHVAVDFIVPRFAPRVRRALYALGLAALGGLFLWALPGVADYLRFMLRERTPVLDLPFGIVYSIFLAAVAMVALRCLAGIVRPRP
ncbi:MAG TPA: TRAP transporter small permease subunit [Burkholderiales bacterium]|nr:TRAP transporter small permease subunit [Burkholderiales bacterium]